MTKKKTDDFLCACTGRKCEGDCKTQHLHRKRNWSDPKNQCTEAYRKREKKNRKGCVV